MVFVSLGRYILHPSYLVGFTDSKRQTMNPVQLEIDVSPDAPAQKSSDTSVAAAKSIEPILNRLEADVFGWFVSYQTIGLTCDQVEYFSRHSHQTVSARIRRLVQLGKLADSGHRRKTRSGRNAVVWKVAR